MINKAITLFISTKPPGASGIQFNLLNREKKESQENDGECSSKIQLSNCSNRPSSNWLKLGYFNQARTLWFLRVITTSWFWGLCCLLFVTQCVLLNSAGPVPIVCPCYLSLTGERSCFVLQMSFQSPWCLSHQSFCKGHTWSYDKSRGHSPSSQTNCLSPHCQWEQWLHCRSCFIRVSCANIHQVNTLLLNAESDFHYIFFKCQMYQKSYSFLYCNIFKSKN